MAMRTPGANASTISGAADSRFGPGAKLYPARNRRFPYPAKAALNAVASQPEWSPFGPAVSNAVAVPVNAIGLTASCSLVGFQRW